MIEMEYLQARKERKKIYIFLIHEIILYENERKTVDSPYIK